MSLYHQNPRRLLNKFSLGSFLGLRLGRGNAVGLLEAGGVRKERKDDTWNLTKPLETMFLALPLSNFLHLVPEL